MAKLSDVVKSGSYMYLASMTNNIGGYVYWLIISILAGPSPLGVTSAIVGLASLITAAFNLGMSLAIQRFIGLCVGRMDNECRKRYFWTALSFALIVYLSVGILLYVLFLVHGGFSNYSVSMLTAVSILVVISGLNQVFWAYLVGRLWTRSLFIASLTGNTVKLVVGPILVYMGYDWIGATVGFIMGVSTIMLVSGLISLRDNGLSFSLDISVLRDLLKAGASGWLPNFIVLMGQWLGVIAVFGYRSSIETGHYYAAYSIAMFLIAISTMVLGVLLPILSSMSEGREMLAARSTRLSLLIVVPLAVYIAYYPRPILGLLGKSYVDASATLSLLVLVSLPFSIITSTTNLAYSYGRYRLVLILGLSQALPRILLYPILTPKYGSFGAGIAVFTGGIIGTISAFYFSGIMRLVHPVRDYLLGILVPFSMLFILKFLGVSWFISIISIIISYIVYIRYRIVPREDLLELLEATLGESRIRKILEGRIGKITRSILGV